MARVLVATQSWGVIWERATDRRLSTPAAGRLASIDTTVYTAGSGGTIISPDSFVTNVDGELPGYVEEGAWSLTVGAESFPVAALGGTLPARTDLLESGEAWIGLQPGYVLQLGDDLIPFWGPGGTTPTGSSLLLETGDTLTTEAGDLLVLES